jgi:hypothetical protein
MRKCSVVFMRSVLILVAMVAIGVLPNMQKADAGDYLGDICLRINVTQRSKGPVDDTGIIKLGISYVGGTHYAVQGVILIPQPDIVGGVCEVLNSDFVCTLNYSEDHSPDPWRDSGIIQIHLNGSTLSGPFWSNYMSFNGSTGSYDQDYDVGTATIATCP